MLKLMKYEFRKQMFSKMVIAIILGVLVGYFAVMNIMDKEQNAAVALGLMFFVMMVAAFYVSMESLVVYSKDLKTKQSYMLFLVPQSSYKILGAKMISAVLQIFFTMAIYIATLGLCGMIYLMKYSDIKQMLEFLKEIFEASFDMQIDFWLVFKVLSTTFILWVFIVILGIFAETLMNTVLTRGKLTSFLSVVMYIFIFWAVARVESGIYDGMIAANISNAVANAIVIIYYLVVDVALYIASAWLIDKKLSV